jgi:ubiquitin-like modifier-activating enzyme ATG7
MPGHPITNEQQTRCDIDMLIKLIDQHDAVFLLTDSRESRWLPTILCSARDKASVVVFFLL